jgi:hypothetical protein
MVGVGSKDSTIAKLSKSAGQNFRLRSELRPETHFAVTAQFIISLSSLCHRRKQSRRFQDNMVGWSSRYLSRSCPHTNVFSTGYRHCQAPRQEGRPHCTSERGPLPPSLGQGILISVGLYASFINELQLYRFLARRTDSKFNKVGFDF